MLLCFTPNPAIDRVLLAPGFRHAESVRVAEARDRECTSLKYSHREVGRMRCYA